ncbi:hypothetical protein ACTQ5K_15780 [Niallia sp. Sow4_A1]|uniref:Transposase n=1 Tax=Niallia hominis TaxID=3133173 RepID=A0ABV1F5B3_9BACI|nr:MULTISPECIES: hypothetical protein [Bacillaceae]MCM3365034.1 hypothetical protein [Niallia sp. MER TA 168]
MTVYNNVIKYKSNRYSLPLGTYRPRGENTVYIEIQEQELVIRRETQGEVLARHPLCHGKGELIKNRQHTRDRSKGIQAYKETLIRQFKDQEKAERFIYEIGSRYQRYIRDQLQVIQSTINHYRIVVDESLAVCIKDQLWSANDLRDVAQHLTRLKEAKAPNPSSIQGTKNSHINTALKATAATREMDDYIKILGGVLQ